MDVNVQLHTPGLEGILSSTFCCHLGKEIAELRASAEILATSFTRMKIKLHTFISKAYHVQ